MFHRSFRPCRLPTPRPTCKVNPTAAHKCCNAGREAAINLGWKAMGHSTRELGLKVDILAKWQLMLINRSWLRWRMDTRIIQTKFGIKPVKRPMFKNYLTIPLTANLSLSLLCGRNRSLAVIVSGAWEHAHILLMQVEKATLALVFSISAMCPLVD